MQVITRSFGVDAGNISVVDLDYIESKGGAFGPTCKRMCELINIEPGKYEVIVDIGDDFDEEEYDEEEYDEEEYNEEFPTKKIPESFEIETTGRIVIGDVCYLFSSGEPSSNHWSDFLDENDFLNINSKSAHFVYTGGDGDFKTIVTFKKL